MANDDWRRGRWRWGEREGDIGGGGGEGGRYRWRWGEREGDIGGGGGRGREI